MWQFLLSQRRCNELYTSTEYKRFRAGTDGSAKRGDSEVGLPRGRAPLPLYFDCKRTTKHSESEIKQNMKAWLPDRPDQEQTSSSLDYRGGYLLYSPLATSFASMIPALCTLFWRPVLSPSLRSCSAQTPTPNTSYYGKFRMRDIRWSLFLTPGTRRLHFSAMKLPVFSAALLDKVSRYCPNDCGAERFVAVCQNHERAFRVWRLLLGVDTFVLG